MRAFFLSCFIFFLGLAAGIGGVVYWQKTQSPQSIFSPDPTPTPEPERPLLKYSIDSSRNSPVTPAAITLDTEPILTEDAYQVFPYSSVVLGRKMSGVINLPATVTASTSAIIMLRGWVPPNQYAPGVGTKNAAAAFAQAGFMTIAPDFFGYGTSDPEPTDEWQARFEKPVAIIELLEGIQSAELRLPDGSIYRPAEIGLWGHSNGGQIALTSLTILQQPIPVALWAPVTAPFPYSILYFSDEEADEGLASRKWISIFDKIYDARQFSFTNYLNGLRGPIQLQQGTNDDAVLKWWSDEFIVKIKKENLRREAERERLDEELSSGTVSGTIDVDLEPIRYEYFLYQGADHNLRPDWDTAIARDITFFQRELNQVSSNPQ